MFKILRQGLAIFGVLFVCSLSHAELLMLSPTKEPPITDEVRETIANMSRTELRGVQSHYNNLLGKLFAYIRLTTGEQPEQPNVVRALTNRQYRDNIYSLKRTAALVIPKFNETVALGKQKQQPIQIFVEGIKIRGKGSETCQARPILETLHLSEIHKLKVVCIERDLNHLEVSHEMVWGYTTAFTIESFGSGPIARINPLKESAKTTRFKVVNGAEDIVITGDLTIKNL